MKGKNSPEKLLEAISKLNAVEFLGVCRVLGIQLYELEGGSKDGVDVDVKAKANSKKFEALWEEVCDIVETMNRIRRRNLGKLVYSATKKGED